MLEIGIFTTQLNTGDNVHIITPNSAIFDEAENRMHAQKALILHLLGVA